MLKMKVDQRKSETPIEDAPSLDEVNFVKEYFGDKLIQLNIRLQNEQSRLVHFQREVHKHTSNFS